MLGAFAESWLRPMVEVLASLGATRVWAVHGSDGLDEITTTGPTQVVSLENGVISHFRITPQDVGLPVAKLDELRGGSAEINAAALIQVLDGAKTAYRDIAVFNAGAALLVAGAATTLPDGVARAQSALDTGAAKAVLARLVTLSNA